MQKLWELIKFYPTINFVSSFPDMIFLSPKLNQERPYIKMELWEEERTIDLSQF